MASWRCQQPPGSVCNWLNVTFPSWTRMNKTTLVCSKTVTSTFQHPKSVSQFNTLSAYPSTTAACYIGECVPFLYQPTFFPFPLSFIQLSKAVIHSKIVLSKNYIFVCRIQQTKLEYPYITPYYKAKHIGYFQVFRVFNVFQTFTAIDQNIITFSGYDSAQLEYSQRLQTNSVSSFFWFNNVFPAFSPKTRFFLCSGLKFKQFEKQISNSHEVRRPRVLPLKLFKHVR